MASPFVGRSPQTGGASFRCSVETNKQGVPCKKGQTHVVCFDVLTHCNIGCNMLESKNEGRRGKSRPKGHQDPLPKVYILLFEIQL